MFIFAVHACICPSRSSCPWTPGQSDPPAPSLPGVLLQGCRWKSSPAPGGRGRPADPAPELRLQPAGTDRPRAEQTDTPCRLPPGRPLFLGRGAPRRPARTVSFSRAAPPPSAAPPTRLHPTAASFPAPSRPRAEAPPLPAAARGMPGVEVPPALDGLPFGVPLGTPCGRHPSWALPLGTRSPWGPRTNDASSRLAPARATTTDSRTAPGATAAAEAVPAQAQ